MIRRASAHLRLLRASRCREISSGKSFMILRSVAVSILLSIPFATAHSSARVGEAQSASPDPRQQLHSLFDEEWQYELRTSPETATALGDNRYNDRLSDHSAEFY